MDTPFDEYTKDWLKKYPYISHDKNGDWSGNAILETSQYLWIKYIIDDILLPERLWDVYENAKVESGLLSRGSHKSKDPQTHDDYIGFVSVAGLLEPLLAWRIYNYGTGHKWNYMLPWTKDFRSWFNGQFWRMPGVVQTIKIAANEPLNLWDRFFLFLGFFGSTLSPANSTSGRLLGWCQLMIYEHKKLNYLLPNLGINLWKRDLKKHYPNLMGDVFSIYYGKDHPFAVFMHGIITNRRQDTKEGP